MPGQWQLASGRLARRGGDRQDTTGGRVHPNGLGQRVHGSQGLVLDFGVGEGRDAIRAVVHSLLGIPAGSDKATRQSAADATIANGLLEPEQRIFLNDLLDLPQSAQDHAIYDAMANTIRKDGKRTAVAEILRALSAEQPLVTP